MKNQLEEEQHEDDGMHKQKQTQRHQEQLHNSHDEEDGMLTITMTRTGDMNMARMRMEASCLHAMGDQSSRNDSMVKVQRLIQILCIIVGIVMMVNVAMYGVSSHNTAAGDPAGDRRSWRWWWYSNNHNKNDKYPNCHVEHPYLINDGHCHDYEPYNTAECGYDGGDCLVDGYPNCHVGVPDWIGNGYCNDWSPYNTPECGFDGGDCLVDGYPDCYVPHLEWIGDGECDGGSYNTPECNFDGGDCE